MSCVVRRLVAVRGYENRVNDIIFAAKITEEIFENVSIFFGGDVQVRFARCCNENISMTQI